MKQETHKDITCGLQRNNFIENWSFMFTRKVVFPLPVKRVPSLLHHYSSHTCTNMYSNTCRVEQGGIQQHPKR